VLHGPEGTGALASGGRRGHAAGVERLHALGEGLDGPFLGPAGVDGVLGIAYGPRRAETGNQIAERSHASNCDGCTWRAVDTGVTIGFRPAEPFLAPPEGGRSM